MLMQILLALADPNAGGGFFPAVSGVAVGTLSPGSCGTGQPAALRASWTVTNPDPVLYTVYVYENGVLVATSVSIYDKYFYGYVESGPGFQFNANITYRVDIVKNSDSSVVSSASSAPWTQVYGTC